MPPLPPTSQRTRNARSTDHPGHASQPRTAHITKGKPTKTLSICYPYLMRGRGLELGERGEIELSAQRKTDGKWTTVSRARAGDRWRARCRYRKADGSRADVSRVAATKTAARQAVERYFLEVGAGGGHLTPRTTVRDAGQWWLGQIERSDSGLSQGTLKDYRSSLGRYVTSQSSGVGSLALSEVTPSLARSWLQGIADTSGTGAARMARSVLSGILGRAARDGVITHNPMRDVGAVAQEASLRRESPLNHERAFTRDERDAVIALAYARAGEQPLHPSTTRKRRAVADLLAYLAGTGCRIEEARAARWADVDLDRPLITVMGTKSASAQRDVVPPAWLVERLRDRATDIGTAGLVFPAPHSTAGEQRPWDQSNSNAAVRDVLNAAGMTWASSHTMRRSAATLMHEAGVPLATISDVLGHANIEMTLSKYLGRRPRGGHPEAAKAL